MDNLFQPQKIYYEKKALEYPLGQKIVKKYKTQGIPGEEIESHQHLPRDEKLSAEQAFHQAKEILVVGIKKSLNFQPCQPSADYRLVFTTSCPGKCHYCYLAATLGPLVYPRVYVNLEELMERTERYIEKGRPKVTSFEASSSSDPLALEHITGALERLIPFFAHQQLGRMRVATKYNSVDRLLKLEHGKHTHFRFSLNTPYIIDSYEKKSPPLRDRIDAAQKMGRAGYPVGFILAPLFIYPGWKSEYKELIREIDSSWDHQLQPPSFELIMHRFTRRAKRIIEERYPETKLKMEAEIREHKGFGKYVYPKKEAKALQERLQHYIRDHFPQSPIEYFT